MNDQETRRNARLGIFVFAGIIIFLVGVFFIGSARNLFNSNITLYAFFHNVEGLQKGNNIWLSGVKIGTVRDVDIVNDSLVRVNLKVREDHAKFIHKDAIASLGTDGLVGNAIVNLQPGTTNTTVADEDTIGVKTEFGMGDLMSIAENSGPALQKTLENLQATTDQLRQNFRDGEGAIGKLLSDKQTAENIDAAITNLKTTSERARVATGQMNQTLSDLRNNRQGVIYTLSTDTSFAGTYAKALQDVQTSTQNVTKATDQLQIMAQKLNSEDNAVNTFLQNEEFARNLENTMKNAKEASRQLDETLEALRYNWLLRGSFKKKDKAEAKAREDSLKQAGQ